MHLNRSSTSSNGFNSLPPEIICDVFDYLSAHEILQAFSNLNRFFNGILLTYPYYRFDFVSISRSNFDLICNWIKPNQVISLTLSDKEDTPGQSELFFSRFRITDFCRIQMLKLINIEHASWEDIYPYLTKMKDSYRLSIESIDNDGLPYARVLFHASEIQIDRIDQLETQFLPYLRCLTVSQSSINQLKLICSCANHLTSLKVNHLIFKTNDDLSLPAHQLIRLVLYFTDIPVSINQMEKLLLNLPRLKYFEVSAKGSVDLADGQVWERLTLQLVTFHFNFWMQTGSIETIFNSFRTPYWVDEKKWFTACTLDRLFSVTHFSSTSADTSFRPPFYSTIPDETIFYDQINRFILNDSQKIPYGFFHNVKTFEVQSLSLSKDLSIFIDLSHVENFTISSSINYSMVSSLMKLMPAVRRFSINVELTDFLQKMKNLRVQQIRILEITRPIMNGHIYFIERLVRLFPKVEILRVTSNLSKLSIARLLDKFENLSSASFSRLHPSNEEIDTESSMTNFIVDNTHRLKRGSFTCRRRIYLVSNRNQKTCFDFWIEKQESKSVLNRHWPLKRGYNYYYLDNLLERNIFYKIFLATTTTAAIEFPIVYTISSPTGHWCTASIQVLFCLAGFMMMKHLKDPLVVKIIFPLVTFVSAIVNYILTGSLNSFFWYNIYCFLRNPFQFTLGDNTGNLLISFYVLLGTCLCNIMIDCRPNELLFNYFEKLKMILRGSLLVLYESIGQNYLVLTTIPFMSVRVYTTLACFFVVVAFFLIELFVKSRRNY